MSDASASRQIDDIVRRMAGWRGERLGQLRALIRDADPGVIEEVKWKKPSRPEGVPVWSHDGIVCIGEVLKNAVRLTFPKRSEEHTSELQSRGHLVCRLLLEKKNKPTT